MKQNFRNKRQEIKKRWILVRQFNIVRKITYIFNRMTVLLCPTKRHLDLSGHTPN